MIRLACAFLLLTTFLFGQEAADQQVAPDSGVSPQSSSTLSQEQLRDKLKEMDIEFQKMSVADLQKQRMLLSKMRENLAVLHVSDPALYQQMKLDMDMWELFLGHLRHIEDMQKKREALLRQNARIRRNSGEN